MSFNNTSKFNDTSCSITVSIGETTGLMMLIAVENSVALAVIFTANTSSACGNGRSSGNTHFLIRLLAGNDFLSAFILLHNSAIVTFTCDKFVENVGCNLLGWVAMSLFCSSLHIVCVMNVERYFMICHPVMHRNHFTQKLCILLISIGVLVMFALFGLPLVGVGIPYYFYTGSKFCGFSLWSRGSKEQAALIGFFGCIGIFLVIVTALANVGINRRLSKKVGAAGKDSVVSKQLATFSTVTKVVAVVNSAMTLPFYIRNLVVSWTEVSTELVDYLTYGLWVATSLVNPVIYIICNNIYRQQFLKPFRKITCKKRVQVEPVREASRNETSISDI